MRFFKLATGLTLVALSLFIFYFFVYLPFVPVNPENPGFRLDDFFKNWYGEERILVHQPDSEETTETPPVKIYKPVFKLRIPALNKAYSVYDGADRQTLMRGPAHIKGTAYPWDERGNVCISGHRVTYGGPFRNLDRIKPGDSVIIETGDVRYYYQVIWVKRVRPDENRVLEATDKPALTLTTCDPPFSARYRLVVRAVLTGKKESPD